MNSTQIHKKLFVGFNWKMNPSTTAQAQELFLTYNNLNSSRQSFLPVVFVPSIYIDSIQQINSSKINIGSQDISDQSSGAFTGQISGQMLYSLDVKYSLVNHSETHRDHKLDFQNITNKFTQALQNDIIPVLCVSFNSLEKAKNDLENQLQNIFTLDLIELIKLQNLTFYIALEPILNIGSGKALSCVEINKYLELIQIFMTKLGLIKLQNYKTLYGGSVNSSNIIEIGKCQLVDGFLLGGASIDTNQVKQIFEKLSS